MIIKGKDFTELQFGKGDICISSGFGELENKPRVPVVVFRNTKPQAIGSRIEFN